MKVPVQYALGDVGSDIHHHFDRTAEVGRLLSNIHFLGEVGGSYRVTLRDGEGERESGGEGLCG